MIMDSMVNSEMLSREIFVVGSLLLCSSPSFHCEGTGTKYIVTMLLLEREVTR